METRSYKLVGNAPLLMHNAQLSDPLNKYSREIKRLSAERKKTDDILMKISEAEFQGGFYWDDKIGPFIPQSNLECMLRDAAKMSKKGKSVDRGLIVSEPAKLEYSGPRDMKKLWEDKEKYSLRNSVGVNQRRVIRTRPMFPEWSLKFSVTFDERVLNAADIDGFVSVAGRLVGVGDWRPKFGRFTSEVLA